MKRPFKLIKYWSAHLESLTLVGIFSSASEIATCHQDKRLGMKVEEKWKKKCCKAIQSTKTVFKLHSGLILQLSSILSFCRNYWLLEITTKLFYNIDNWTYDNEAFLIAELNLLWLSKIRSTHFRCPVLHNFVLWVYCWPWIKGSSKRTNFKPVKSRGRSKTF